jgi:hypothetical protein
MKALWILVVALGCGGGGKAAPEPVAEHHDEHGAMMPEVAKFHDALAPRWHAPKGDKRMTDTCGAVPELRSDADALAKAKAPGDAATWSTRTQDLTDAVSALGATCESHDATAFELAFQKVHESFHAVMETSGGHHEM